MENMSIYNVSRIVPPEAQKKIGGGRLSGMTDINPMWRIKCLTEQFGPCGIGWKYVITKQWLEHGGNEEIAAFVNIELFIKVDGQWSDAIPGTGGSSFVTKEKGGLYTSDECFKMALTDAISVSCKALGVGADVYWGADNTKYSRSEQQAPQSQSAPSQANNQQQAPQGNNGDKASDAQLKAIYAFSKKTDMGNDEMKNWLKIEYGVDSSKELTKKQASNAIEKLQKMVNQAS